MILALAHSRKRDALRRHIGFLIVHGARLRRAIQPRVIVTVMIGNAIWMIGGVR